MTARVSIRRSNLVSLVLLGLILAGFCGCASTEPDNYSVRPWNSPKSWEGGFPSGMMEGR